MTALMNIRMLERRAEVLNRLANALDQQIAQMGLKDARAEVFFRTMVVGQREAAKSLAMAAAYWREAHTLHFGHPPQATARPNLRVVSD